MRGARYIGERSHCRRDDLVRDCIAQIEDQDRRFGLGFGQRLDGDVGHGGERAPGAGKELAQIVAGDVLDHAAAGFERLAAA